MELESRSYEPRRNAEHYINKLRDYAHEDERTF